MACCMKDILPRMHMTADLKIAKDSLHLNQPMIEGTTLRSETESRPKRL